MAGLLLSLQNRDLIATPRRIWRLSHALPWCAALDAFVVGRCAGGVSTCMCTCVGCVTVAGL